MSSPVQETHTFTEAEVSPPSGSFPPEPEFPDFEPTSPDGSRKWWDGDSDEPKSPDSTAAGMIDSDEETPTSEFDDLRKDQAQRWLSQKRWGFVIYRCTYSDNEKWVQFMEVFEAMARCSTVDDPEIDATLAFDVREDPARFDSEDLSACRAHFESWIHSDEIGTEIWEKDQKDFDKDADFLHRIQSIQMNKWKPAHLTCPRYSYFIYVDELAMETVLAHTDNTQWRNKYCGFVNIVNIDDEVGSWSVRQVTPSHLYPCYYKTTNDPGYWHISPKPPFVDIGDMGAF